MSDSDLADFDFQAVAREFGLDADESTWTWNAGKDGSLLQEEEEELWTNHVAADHPFGLAQDDLQPSSGQIDRFSMHPGYFDLPSATDQGQGIRPFPAVGNPSAAPGSPLVRSQHESVRWTPGHTVVARPGPQVASVPLYPVSALPDSVRALFRFPFFNAMQSSCISAILDSDEDVVVSAPTGSGKTVLFELALVRMLRSYPPGSKAVYLAPTKALCGEKSQDWAQRFAHVGFSVIELTGDSYLGLKEARDCRLIISTPEKWDGLTRRWNELHHVLSSVRLFMMDEVHILNEIGRGPRLEVIVSRTKVFVPDVRFVALSATVPNLNDVASWIGGRPYASHNGVSDPSPARMFTFGEEFRPCPLQKYVHGYPRAKDEYTFQSSLNHKLFDLILRYSKGRPSIVFVATRKATFQAAGVIAERYRLIEAEAGSQMLPWRRPSQSGGFADPTLNQLAPLGVACHHAGLSFDDRKEVERRFLAEEIGVLCSTSTLATGVNLPAFCVIIRGTKQFANGRWDEYSDLDVIQMMGRAGRPQFDREGVAVILCEQEQQQRFEELVSGGRDIESTLGHELIEHINAEIGLQNCRDVQGIERWLRGTFYAVRLRKKTASPQDFNDAIKKTCADALQSLAVNGLVTHHGPASTMVEATDAGSLMSRLVLRYDTMLRLLSMGPNLPLSKLLEVLCQAEEFGEVKIRHGEKGFLDSIRSHSEIRFPPKKVAGVADKVSLLIQANLACLNLHALAQRSGGGGSVNFNPAGDTLAIFRHAPRVCRAIAELSLQRRDGPMAKASFELLRSICGRAWDSSPAVLRQLEGIGEKSIKALAAGNLATIDQVAEAEPHHIELLLNRHPPFGSRVIRSARSLPRFELTIAERDTPRLPVRDAEGSDAVEGQSYANRGDGDSGRTNDASGGDRDTVTVKVEVTVRVRDYREVSKRSRTTGLPFQACIMVLSSDLTLFNFSKIPLKALEQGKLLSVPCPITRRGQKVIVLAACDEVAGSCVRAELKPNVPDSAFRPPHLATFGCGLEDEQLLSGLEDEADFFKFDDDSDDQGVCPDRLTRAPRVNTEVPELVRLANGNYKCRHTCKGTCRHLCCREGLPKPPKGSTTTARARSSDNRDKAFESTSKEVASKPRARRNATEVRQDAANLLAKLDRLNRLTAPTSSVEAGSIGSGDREEPTSPTTKRRRLSDGRGDHEGSPICLVGSDSDEDVPLVRELFARERLPAHGNDQRADRTDLPEEDANRASPSPTSSCALALTVERSQHLQPKGRSRRAGSNGSGNPDLYGTGSELGLSGDDEVFTSDGDGGAALHAHAEESDRSKRLEETEPAKASTWWAPASRAGSSTALGRHFLNSIATPPWMVDGDATAQEVSPGSPPSSQRSEAQGKRCIETDAAFGNGGSTPSGQIAVALEGQVQDEPHRSDGFAVGVETADEYDWDALEAWIADEVTLID